MNRILVTGASGFIGRHVLAALAAREAYQVHAVTSKSSPPSADGCTWHTADLLQSATVKELLRLVTPTHLLHLAWCTDPGEYWTSADNFRWVQASLELLRGFDEHGGQRIVVAGTCAEYDWGYGYCKEFVTPKAPATPYGVCKRALQMMLDAYSTGSGLSSAWGRIFSVFGPHERPERLVPSVIRALLQGETAHCSHGNQIRDFMYVRDVADAFVALLESDVQGPVNIASGHPVAIKEVVSKIAARLGRPDRVLLGSVPVPENDPLLLVADTSRLFDEVGWSPSYDMDRGLEETLSWWTDRLSEGDE